VEVGGVNGRRRPLLPVEVLQDVLARITAAREEYEPLVREQILEDLEEDLASDFEELRRAA
jgi:hypothetical protein